MKNTINQVGELLTDRAEFAPKFGRCPQCGWLHCMPEPHHPECSQNTNAKRPVYRYSIDAMPIQFNQINPQ